MRNRTLPRLNAYRALTCALLVACGGDPSGLDEHRRTGAIRVAVTMTGADLPLSYTVAVAGRTTSASPDADATISDLLPGVHNVLLGVQRNCRVDGVNPRQTTVVPGDTTPVAFSVTCTATTGSLRVATVTTGLDVDPNGYLVQVNGLTILGTDFQQASGVATTGSVTLVGVPATPVWVTLVGLSLNCDVAGLNPRSVSVAVAETLTVAFDVVCAAATGQIAYVGVIEEGRGDIHVINSDGTGARRLTIDPSTESDPAWSRDGKKIAFTSDRDANLEIYGIDADGSNVVRITNDPRADYQPTWSPDGARIAFVSDRDGNAEIYVMNADGTNVVRLTNHGGRDTDPAWSPDGRSIAFTSERDGRAEVYIMDTGGSGLTRFTTGGGKQPAWSPDGTRIAYAGPYCPWFYGCAPSIFVQRIGGQTERLAMTVGDGPTWSPDGRKIAYDGLGCDFYLISCDQAGIQVARVDGTSVVGDVRGNSPAWRP